MWAVPIAGSAHPKHSRHTALATTQLLAGVPPRSSSRVCQHTAAGCNPCCCSAVQIVPRWSSAGTGKRAATMKLARSTHAKQRWPPRSFARVHP